MYIAITIATDSYCFSLQFLKIPEHPCWMEITVKTETEYTTWYVSD